MVRVVVASDKFKGSLTSEEVAAAVGAGVRRVHPDATVVPIPVADGGDGTLTAAVAAGYHLIPVVASGPTGTAVHTAYARSPQPPEPGVPEPGTADRPADASRSPAPASGPPHSDGVPGSDGSPVPRGSTGPSSAPSEGISVPVTASPLIDEGRRPRSRGYPLEQSAGLAAARGDSGGRGDVAVVELADACGLVRLPGGYPAPTTATSRGAGELIAAAIDAGCTRIVLGIGGSASTDGGAGLVRALGARLLRSNHAAPHHSPGDMGPRPSAGLRMADAAGTAERVSDGAVRSAGAADNGQPSSGAVRSLSDGDAGQPSLGAVRSLSDGDTGQGLSGAACSSDGAGLCADVVEGGAGLVDADSLDLVGLRRRLEGVEVVVASDVDNPLTGPRGAAAVYGPQKGADQRQVVELDGALTRWADLVARETGRDLRDAPGAGAAGGVGFAALALLDAELRPGIELMLELVGFREQLAGADLVITGEGALDEQTLHGKAVAGVAAVARAAGIPVVAVCGINQLDTEQLREVGMRAAYALTDLEPDVQKCIAEPRPLLERIGERIAREHLTMTRSERGIA